MKPVDVATLTLLGALWGSSYLFIRIGAPSFGPAAFMGSRVAIAALVLWVASRVFAKRFSFRPYLVRFAVLGFINAALPFTLIATAELRLTASLVAVLGATVPLFVALISAIWLKERIAAPRAVGLVLGMIGVAILTGWSAPTLDAATVMSIGAVLLGALSYAVAGIYSKRKLQGLPPSALALGQQVSALCWLAIPMATRWPETTPTTSAIGSLLALAILSTSLAFVLFFRLIARIGPTRTSMVTYIAPVFGMIGGAAFLGEPVTPPMVAGFVVIALSVVAVSWTPRTTKPAPLDRHVHRGESTFTTPVTALSFHPEVSTQ